MTVVSHILPSALCIIILGAYTPSPSIAVRAAVDHSCGVFFFFFLLRGRRSRSCSQLWQSQIRTLRERERWQGLLPVLACGKRGGGQHGKVCASCEKLMSGDW